jgi:hypothetical protein
MTAIRTLVILASALGLSLAPSVAHGQPLDISSHAEAVDDNSLTAVMPALLRAVETWLTSNFDLAVAAEQPRIAIVPTAHLAAVRNQALRRASSQAVLVSESHNVAAFYHDMTRTIHLPAGWTGATAAEISVLVHEMVHHLQNMAGLRYACPQAREALAFEAQERWLALSGKSLAGEFGLDGMTMLVRTRCMF